MNLSSLRLNYNNKTLSNRVGLSKVGTYAFMSLGAWGSLEQLLSKWSAGAKAW